jgi:hypothetical protein
VTPMTHVPLTCRALRKRDAIFFFEKDRYAILSLRRMMLQKNGDIDKDVSHRIKIV